MLIPFWNHRGVVDGMVVSVVVFVLVAVESLLGLAELKEEEERVPSVAAAVVETKREAAEVKPSEGIQAELSVIKASTMLTRFIRTNKRLYDPSGSSEQEDGVMGDPASWLFSLTAAASTRSLLVVIMLCYKSSQLGCEFLLFDRVRAWFVYDSYRARWDTFVIVAGSGLW